MLYHVIVLILVLLLLFIVFPEMNDVAGSPPPNPETSYPEPMYEANSEDASKPYNPSNPHPPPPYGYSQTPSVTSYAPAPPVFQQQSTNVSRFHLINDSESLWPSDSKMMVAEFNTESAPFFVYRINNDTLGIHPSYIRGCL